ncbi:hypothetical protein BE04_46305 [Sorangium cellulosum]|uniref:Uncharacterized protein n=1 Tax=Sorangium cellulosum TaxID=56 RepID=A0A150PQD2_SORCE|nr:hypothetical protein BE04_46305 [Sorangium cellulosum]
MFLWASLMMDLAHLGLAALWTRALRIPVKEFAIGYGAVILRAGAFSLRAVPIGAWFDPVVRKPKPSAVTGSTPPSGARDVTIRTLEDASLGASVGLALLAAGVSFAAAALLLGPGHAVDASSAAARSYLLGAMSPLADAPRHLDAALDVYRSNDHRVALGSAAAIIAGINVLWAPSNVMFLLGVTASKRGWLQLRGLLWLAARAIEASWMLGFVVWVVRAW